MDNNMDEDVKNILAILQGTPEIETEAKPIAKAETVKKNSITKKNNPTATPSVFTPKKEVVKTVIPTLPHTYLTNVEEPEDKSIYSTKVLIREEVYEVFMSLKRIKKFKSVSTLIDFALTEYIKNNKEDIRKTIYDTKKSAIL
jgi:hypothetical protein